MNQLTKALEGKRFGILCITPENQENPWIHFEAGALWKADEERRVCPLLYDIRPGRDQRTIEPTTSQAILQVRVFGCHERGKQTWLFGFD